MKALSPTMCRLIEYAKQHDDEIIRYAGGFWAHEDWRGTGSSFGTSTVEALVARGVMEYIEFKDGKNRRFPIAAKLTAPKGTK